MCVRAPVRTRVRACKGVHVHVRVCARARACVCVCVGLRERLHVRVRLARVRTRLRLRMWVRALKHAGVRACVREYACMIYHTRLSNIM